MPLFKWIVAGMVFLVTGCLGYSPDAALHSAANTGNLGTVIQTISEGAKIDSVNEKSQSALMLAAQGGYTGVVKYLVSRGANIKQKDATGNTALDLATQARKREVVDFLRSHLGLPPLDDKDWMNEIAKPASEDESSKVRRFSY
ncbi:MAG: ankyrin repeat domain-containing protein [SAR324 cluster bacterium]|nr:ankyrin repeat domain-containing protein [SAR324 cluster bacterium]MBF0349688.1 ankyrin repeat domain-containing protein [SAR324 cluster bacterium]